ncbi:MAG: aminotransferase class V-fold PLP-dependent enzyme [Bryobacterales bacterium]|nr:aminotransferase class V-fold PLP-dependent enzyme [Bryobacterales bacterium]
MATSDLQMSPEEMRTCARRVVELLVEREETLRDGPPWDGEFQQGLAEQFHKAPPEEGRNAAEVIEQAAREILPFAARLDHPRFFGFVPVSPTWPSVLADFMSAAWTVNQCTWLTASGPSQIELTVIDWIRQWLGCPDGAGGLFVSGASDAAVHALVAAREAAGAPAGPTVYMSDQTHSSIARAALTVGVRPEHVRSLPSDSEYRLDLALLARRVAADRAAGLAPIAVCANAGTASTGTVDPLAELADYCAAEGIWLHVDAAYGGFAAVTEIGRRKLAGIGRADSISIDAHKWFFQPYEAGCLLVKDVQTLERPFTLRHDVIQDTIWGSNHPNVADRGVQLSRAARSLKLWMSVQTFGMAAFRRSILRGFELARHAEEQVRSNPMLELLHPASLSIVCFRVNPGGLDEDALETLNKNVLAKVFWDGHSFISSTTLRRTFALRLCIVNRATTSTDVSETLDQVVRFGRDWVQDYERGKVRASEASASSP